MLDAFARWLGGTMKTWQVFAGCALIGVGNSGLMQASEALDCAPAT